LSRPCVIVYIPFLSEIGFDVLTIRKDRDIRVQIIGGQYAAAQGIVKRVSARFAGRLPDKMTSALAAVFAAGIFSWREL